jgi:preprotein translocase subunit SecG
MSLETAIYIAQILVSVALVALLLLQAKGSGFGAALGGSSGSVFRTRRGVEKTLLQLTVVLTIIFVVICLLSVRVSQ